MGLGWFPKAPREDAEDVLYRGRDANFGVVTISRVQPTPLDKLFTKQEFMENFCKLQWVIL